MSLSELFTLLGIIAALATALTAIFRSKRQSNTEDRKVDIDEFTALKEAYKDQFAEMRKEIADLKDELKAVTSASDRKVSASARIIKDLARQWQGPRPKLNPNDIAELEADTIPAAWLHDH